MILRESRKIIAQTSAFSIYLEIGTNQKPSMICGHCSWKSSQQLAKVGSMQSAVQKQSTLSSSLTLTPSTQRFRQDPAAINEKNDITSLTQLLTWAKLHHGRILCKQILINDCSLK